MSCQFHALRDEAVAAAEEGDWGTAVARFRAALAAAAAAAGSGPADPAPASDSTADARQVLLLPEEEYAAVHDMLAQCLMALAMEAPAAETSFAGNKQEGAAVVPGGGGEHDLWQEALEHAAQATSARPNWPPALLTYGRCLRNVGLLDEALRVLNSAAEVMLSPSGRLGAGCSHAPHSSAPPAPGGQSAGASPAAAPGWDAELEAEVRAELEEVGELWARRLARQVGLPGLRLMQDAGAVLGGGPGRRVWDCSVLLAAYLVASCSSCAAAATAASIGAPSSRGGGGGGGEGIAPQAASAAGTVVVRPGKLPQMGALKAGVGCA
ncbi:hypothetical protein HYH02_010827 [Chlamydomonas schloesseri]|uniref:Uncharacterized protein n=1 Tax=Chlamydomonas schloesseri TaxID=2026947 RepID=A0A835W2P8_9CHLO|nr:hypothetical protein HYH02_010827 [Chlamydomonas schloesseri]|eukprot:KAG2438372.1 hypothetical protein HYH02_010827 [Chlamydomonas schloesseri]